MHLPVMLFFVLLGIWFTLGDPWLYPLFLVYAVIGIYFGRDVAIFAHYNGLITIVVVGGWVALIRSPVPPPHFAPLISAAITGAITIVFATYVSWYVDLDNDEKPKTSSSRFSFLQHFIDRIDDAAARDDDSVPIRLRKTLLIFLCSAGILIAPWAPGICGRKARISAPAPRSDSHLPRWW